MVRSGDNGVDRDVPDGAPSPEKFLNTALPVDELVKLFWRRDGPNELHERGVTAQDRMVFGLCRPERTDHRRPAPRRDPGQG